MRCEEGGVREEEGVVWQMRCEEGSTVTPITTATFATTPAQASYVFVWCAYQGPCMAPAVSQGTTTNIIIYTLCQLVVCACSNKLHLGATQCTTTPIQ